MNDVTIRCFYSCADCGLKDVSVNVTAREPNEDVAAWMDQTVRALGADHARRSGQCHPKALQEVKIPITHAAYIGGPPVQ